MIKYSIDQEPIISVGLVLPSDKQKVLFIIDSKNKKSYKIKCQNNNLYVNDVLVDFFELKSEDNQDIFSVNDIPAGRGFHWEKSIAIKVKGSLKVTVIVNSLFLTNYIPIESYLMCVATSEMSGKCPISLLESQTIAARSWLLAAVEKKHQNLGLDVCNDDCCQRYQGINQLTQSAINASKNTRGNVLFSDTEICDTRYSKSCGGFSENNQNVWKTPSKTYLQGLYDNQNEKMYNLEDEDSFIQWIKSPPSAFCNNQNIDEKELKYYLGTVDEKASYFRWRFNFSQVEITKIINKKMGLNCEYILSIIPIKRGVSGRIIKLKIIASSKNKVIEFLLNSEYEIRRVLHTDFLYSSAFIVETTIIDNPIPTNFILKGAGWGHGVGLCQIGALGMALKGKKTNEILSHYFSSTELKKIYD